MTKDQITMHFKLNAKQNLKTGGLHQAYIQGAEDCYDYIKTNEEKKVSLDWEYKCNELQEKLNCMVHTHEEQLKTNEDEINNLKNREDILRAKLEIVELIFGK